MLRRFLLSLFVPRALSAAVAAQSTDEWRSWNQPMKPFRVVGNVYYVGAADSAASPRVSTRAFNQQGLFLTHLPL